MKSISHESLKEMLNYNPETGEFVWKIARQSIQIGDVAGSRYLCGYIKITINRKRYAAHRLAWFYVHSTWPQKQIDHINRNRSDNRIRNLREASRSENNANSIRKSKIGVRGVEFRAYLKHRPYRAVIQRHGVRYHLGFFNSVSEASSAYQAAAQRLYGEFANPTALRANGT